MKLGDLLDEPFRVSPPSAVELEVVGIASALRWVEPGFVLGLAEEEPSLALVEQAAAQGAVALIAEPGHATTVHLLGQLLDRLGGCGRIGTLGIHDGRGAPLS